MATTSVTSDQDAIVAEIQIAAPPERVFQALSDADQLKQWFTSPDCPAKSWKMNARVGGSYAYESEPGSVEINGVRAFECHGEILESDPPRLLVYTWIANWHEDKNSRTIVRWELTPKQNGTFLRVTHSGLRKMPIVRKDYAGGWPGVVEGLKRFVEGRRAAL